MTKPSTSDIKAIMQSYGLDDSAFKGTADILYNYESVVALIELAFGNFDFYTALQHIYKAELFKLIQLLRACKGSALEIKGTITKPKGKQLKGTELSTTISNQEFLTWLEVFVNTWAEREQDGLFQFAFGWDFKQPLTLRRGQAPVFEEEQHPFFTESYSDEEISQIIDYYDKIEKSHPKLTKNGKLGSIANRIVTIIIKSACIDWTQTKLYSLVYDLMLLGKITGKECITLKGFSGDIGREKSQQVRNWLQAFNRDIGKWS